MAKTIDNVIRVFSNQGALISVSNIARPAEDTSGRIPNDESYFAQAAWSGLDKG